jgi:hypothetical protein
MELSGVIVTIKTKALVDALVNEHRNDRAGFEARIQRSYTEVCLDSDLSIELNGLTGG